MLNLPPEPSFMQGAADWPARLSAPETALVLPGYEQCSNGLS